MWPRRVALVAVAGGGAWLPGLRDRLRCDAPGTAEPPEPPARDDAAPTGAVPPTAKGVGPSSSASNRESWVLREGLKQVYNGHIRPLETRSLFAEWQSKPLQASDFESKPNVLVLGQYSVGKTSSLRYLLGQDFASMRIGPEPTTDNWTVVLHGRDDTVVPGNAAVVQAQLPYQGLSGFGTAFLNKFKVVQCSSALLEGVTLLDTPGVLAGEKQRIGRAYEFERVVGWFAERSDLILVMFDTSKVDISDEMKQVVQQLRGHEDKVRVVLNKADTVAGQELMRVYGALLWSLGKVLSTPEVVRVYVLSLWDKKVQSPGRQELVLKEERDLLKELEDLPRNAAMAKVSELAKRLRTVKVHACLINALASQMPWKFGRTEKKSELLAKLDKVFDEVRHKHGFAHGDMPEFDAYRRFLASANWDRFEVCDEQMLASADSALANEIPALISRAQHLADRPDEFEQAKVEILEAAKQLQQSEPRKQWF